MPLYEFHCSKCDLKFEVVLDVRDYDRLPPCPKCGTAEYVRHVVSSFHVQAPKKADRT
jgi:putative FmdB family regulatory protein